MQAFVTPTSSITITEVLPSWTHLTDLTPVTITLTSTRTVEVATLTEVSRAETVNTPGWHFHTPCRDAAHADTARLFITSALFSSNGMASEHAIYCVSDVA